MWQILLKDKEKYQKDNEDVTNTGNPALNMNFFVSVPSATSIVM